MFSMPLQSEPIKELLLYLYSMTDVIFICYHASIMEIYFTFQICSRILYFHGSQGVCNVSVSQHIEYPVSQDIVNQVNQDIVYQVRQDVLY